MFKTMSPLFDIVKPRVKAKRNILRNSAFRYGSLTTTIWREMSRKREMSRSFFAGIITKTIYATNSASPTLFSQYFHFYRFFIAISTIFNSTSFYLFHSITRFVEDDNIIINYEIYSFMERPNHNSYNKSTTHLNR